MEISSAGGAQLYFFIESGDFKIWILKKYVFRKYIVLKIYCSDNIPQKCPSLKSGVWDGFLTEIAITRQPYNRKKYDDKLSIYQGVAQNLGWVQNFRRTVDGEIHSSPKWVVDEILGCCKKI